MEVIFKFFLAVLFVASTPSMTTFIPPYQRYLTAFTTDNCTGLSNTFYDNVPDLDPFSLTNAIKSVRLTGWWAFYSNRSYVTLVANSLGVDLCYQPLSLEIRSLRYIGSPNGFNDVYYNFYLDSGYEGIELGGNTNLERLGELDREVSDLTITGPSPWTFYGGLEYTGASVCAYPSYTFTAADGTVLNYNFLTVAGLDMPDNFIRSVAQGCLSTRVTKDGPSQDASQLDRRCKAEHQDEASRLFCSNLRIQLPVI